MPVTIARSELLYIRELYKLRLILATVCLAVNVDKLHLPSLGSWPEASIGVDVTQIVRYACVVFEGLVILCAYLDTLYWLARLVYNARLETKIYVRRTILCATYLLAACKAKSEQCK